MYGAVVEGEKALKKEPTRHQYGRPPPPYMGQQRYNPYGGPQQQSYGNPYGNPNQNRPYGHGRYGQGYGMWPPTTTVGFPMNLFGKK